ncbi:4-alpha-glucanotransferase [Dethiosulfovibrio salsuginis]|uniref:4-alpha-glucanotransferase n=1 Tax=Dethiosulfovibrio salsuginis TaxID=561720 RepID=A0A1X7L3P6_9BACT|nr:4-alpha-glucanotransferase [Dethiosulfovibrio salsuginis]SMG48360.1 4-alpha-glucanotransferase [Dethiosulfovibrio salsuginis]
MRRSGLLLHISSLPSPWGTGDLGPWAYHVARNMARSSISVWQILPLNETSSAFGHSPYSPTSVFAGNRAFISPEELVKDGFILKSELPEKIPIGPSDFDRALEIRTALIAKSWERGKDLQDFKHFKEENRLWLENYCLFTVIKDRMGQKPWNLWPEPLRDREEEALSQIADQEGHSLDRLAFGQYLFFQQQRKWKKECNRLGLEILGDIPIYVIHDSSDVWANPDLFQLDDERLPSSVAGVPPDYYSEDGQLWGNPLYLWENHLAQRFSWWINRLRHCLTLYDRVRIDHFRGMVGYWAVPRDHATAREGRWEKVPYDRFFKAIRETFPDLPFTAEDLGVITPEVKRAMEDLGLAGMAVLQFAFDGDTGTNPYVPHNHRRNSVIYTGTHDNDTTAGWFKKAGETTVKNLQAYTGRQLDHRSAVDSVIRMALASVAELAVVPAQDVLGLDSEARINTPSTTTGNWTWRLKEDIDLEWIGDMTILYGRANTEDRPSEG